MPYDPTPLATPEQVNANLSLTGGRIGSALKELKRRLQTQLPAQIDYENERLALEGNRRYSPPKTYAIAPANLTDKHVHSVLIGASVQKRGVGTRAFKNVAVISIFVVDQRIEIEEQVSDAWDVSDLIAGIMLSYLNGCVDESGRFVWQELVPLEQTMMPEQFADYSGVTLNYQLSQHPSIEMWETK